MGKQKVGNTSPDPVVRDPGPASSLEKKENSESEGGMKEKD